MILHKHLVVGMVVVILGRHQVVIDKAFSFAGIHTQTSINISVMEEQVYDDRRSWDWLDCLKPQL